MSTGDLALGLTLTLGVVLQLPSLLGGLGS